MNSDGTDDTSVLELRDVRKSFGDVTVLDGVTLRAAADSVTCLLGPNGSGKTTLLSIVAGLLDADGGSVERRDDTGRVVGYLPQRPAFRSRFTVQETIEFYGRLVPAEVDVDGILARVGLDGVADRRVEHLSGGMTRLLGLAQATVGSPSLLVLDEPASGLDPQLRRHIASVIADLATDGTAVIVATHDLVATDRIADEVRILDSGSFVASGSPDALRAETGTDSLDDVLDTVIERDETIGVRSGIGGGDG
ncbi:ABC transporter ATP-binding protein [Halorhabdus amylolytica]|uniref:ABC transporter ATP-binding protein n=1 Tax=Halorhabdus amylolytica TaxID=2559573 RepID=UPI0010AB227F|nr:ABC transporter ATP-binding protein [Halorhabdus amylolytica]